MSKAIKISIIFVIIFSLFIVVSNAETTNIYNDVVNEESTNTDGDFLDENSSDSELTDTDDFDIFEDENQEPQNTTGYYTPNYSSSVSTMSSISEANLGLNNVLCVILIAIGILIILLAIAILIRLKK